MRLGLGLRVFGVGDAIDLSGEIGRYTFDVANVTRPNTPTNNNVSQVNDLSANARHLTQGADANRPVWTDSAQDYALVDTGGTTSKRLIRTGMGATFAATYEWTVFLVVQVDTAPNVNQLHTFAQVGNSATGRGGFIVGAFSTTQTRRLSVVRASDGSSRNYDFGVATLGARELWCVRIAGPSNGGDAIVTSRVNGVQVVGSGSSFSNHVDANAYFQSGTSNGTGKSRIWHMEMFARALNDGSILARETALAALYPLT